MATGGAKYRHRLYWQSRTGTIAKYSRDRAFAYVVWNGNQSCDRVSVNLIEPASSVRPMPNPQSLHLYNYVRHQPCEANPDHRGQTAIGSPMPVDVGSHDRENDRALGQEPNSRFLSE